MKRHEIINAVLARIQGRKYLEIGLANPAACYELVQAETKHSVDPGNDAVMKLRSNQALFQLSSDQFFLALATGRLALAKDYQWDVIFIDGLHLAEQVWRDIHNALKHLAPGGYVIVHDCNPPTIHHAREDYLDFQQAAGMSWMGTSWKAIQRLRSERKDLEVCVVDTDWGVGLIRRGVSKRALSPDLNPFYEYRKLDACRAEILNLIHPYQLDEWLAQS